MELIGPLKIEAKKRQKEGAKVGAAITNKTRLPAPVRKAVTQTAAKQAAAITGVSERTVESATYVKENDPKEFERIKSGETTPKAAERKVREQRTPRKTKEEIADKHRSDFIDQMAVHCDVSGFINIAKTCKPPITARDFRADYLRRMRKSAEALIVFCRGGRR